MPCIERYFWSNIFLKKYFSVLNFTDDFERKVVTGGTEQTALNFSGFFYSVDAEFLLIH